MDTTFGDPLPIGDVSYTGEILRVTGTAIEAAVYTPGTVTIVGMGDIDFSSATQVDLVNFDEVDVPSRRRRRHVGHRGRIHRDQRRLAARRLFHRSGGGSRDHRQRRRDARRPQRLDADPLQTATDGTDGADTINLNSASAATAWATSPSRPAGAATP